MVRPVEMLFRDIIGFTPKYCLSPPSPHLTLHRRSWPADRARPQYRRARFQHRIASAIPSSYRPQALILFRRRLHTHAQILPLPPQPPTSHSTAAPGRPIARDPGTGGHGFSIASPRPCTHPIGPNISYSPGMGFIVLKHSIELKSQELVLRLASVFLAHEAHSTNHVTICAHARSMSMQTPSHA